MTFLSLGTLNNHVTNRVQSFEKKSCLSYVQKGGVYYNKFALRLVLTTAKRLIKFKIVHSYQCEKTI